MTTAIHTPIIPGYQISEELYAGSRTRVYRGIRDQDFLAVVIKILTSEYPSFNELLQFRNQYSITKNLKIPGIIHPLSLEAFGNSYILVMEDTGEISLKEYIKTHALSLAEFLLLAIQLTDILHYLYQNRVIHKDIKPANILIHPETKQVKLIDFSIASLLVKESQEIKSPNVLEGTLAYISPEQTGRMNRGIDYRSDFYSLGVTFFEILTGQLPFISDDPMELVHCHIAQQAGWVSEIKSEIPQVISEIIAKLMAKNAEDRYQSALGLKHDLETCLCQLKDSGEIRYFEIGQRDLCDRFLIPEKLYGREGEVETLRSGFDRVAQGDTEMMLVAGFSGIGKTAVINEVHKPIVRQRGYFIKGKFDQFNRNIPFSAFVQAFRDLMRQLLSESDAQLALWKTQILVAVGENGQVIIEVIPELEQIIGKQPDVAELSGSAAQNRFNLLFGKFVRVFTTKEHPLVIFLDDLQWADSASLNLLKLLMDESEAGYLLVLGAYRDNEVFPAHPLMLTLDEIQKQGTNINTLTLDPLDELDITRLVADTLLCSAEIAAPLSQLVYQKTQGNPFFTTQFLKGSYEDGCIRFDAEVGYWKCDLAQVRQLALTEDVVVFMVGRLRKLPSGTQVVLKLAACIGNRFDLATLAVVCECSKEEVATELWRGLQEGFVIPSSETYKFFQGKEREEKGVEEVSVSYRFLHDRIQQAAYSLIPETQKQTTHLKIGQLLLKNTPAAEQEERIFEIVSQFNYGINLIIQPAERKHLAELNLMAGKKAKISTAYAAAVEYLNQGLSLLETESWQHSYDLTLALHTEAMEAEYLNANVERSQTLAQTVLQNAASQLDMIKVYETKVQIYITSMQVSRAIDAGLQALEFMGLSLEKILEYGLQEAFLPQLHEVKGLPEMTEPYQLTALRILIAITSAALISRPEILLPIVLTQVHLCLKHGHSALSSFSYSWYGALLCTDPKTIDKGYHSGQLALELLERFPSNSLKCQVYNMFHVFVKPWKEAARETLNPLIEGLQSGLEVGDLVYSSYCVENYCTYLFVTGENLVTVEQKQTQYIDLMQKIKNDYAACNIRIWKQLNDNLQARTANPYQLSGNSFDEVTMLPQLQADTIGWTLFNVYLAKVILLYLLEDYGGAITSASLAAESAISVGAWMPVVTNNFYYSLALLAEYSSIKLGEQKHYISKIEENQERLKHWAHHAPSNFQHKYDLVEAERHRIFGEKMDAIELYDRAIVEAKKNNYIQEEALANELAAKFYLDWGKEKFAAGYMEEAYYCYVRWGAKAKVEHLEQHYPQLLAKILQPKNLTITPGTTIASTQMRSLNSTNSSQNLWLDFPAIMKAAQTISQEIELEKLLTTLMQIVLANAGAQTGHLILRRGKQWLVVAQACQEQAKTLEIPLEQYQNIPQSLIYSVARTQETAVFENLSTAAQFAGNSYIITYQPKSVLCTPIIRQGKLVGILYLENNLTLDAFTSDRVEILQLLTSQAAISLENARLYQQTENYSQILEAEVERKTQALSQKAQDLEQALKTLQQTQAQLIQNEKMSSLGQLVAGVAHEINNPINFIKGNLNHTKSYFKDMMSLLTLYQQEYPQPSQAIKAKRDEIEFDFLFEDVKKILESMELGSHRISQIILSLRNFSRLDESAIKTVDLHSGIESTLLILQHRFQDPENQHQIRVVKEYGNTPNITCYPSQLNQVFLNIINNAIDAIGDNSQSSESPEILIRTEVIDSKWVRITIANTGSPIPLSIQEKIFEPFFTTKPVGRGTGLGLFVSYSIIQKHGGTLTVHSQPGEKTKFEIIIPQESGQM